MTNKLKLTKDNISIIKYGDYVLYNGFVGKVLFDHCAPGGLSVDDVPILRILDNYEDVYLVYDSFYGC